MESFSAARSPSFRIWFFTQYFISAVRVWSDALGLAGIWVGVAPWIHWALSLQAGAFDLRLVDTVFLNLCTVETEIPNLHLILRRWGFWRMLILWRTWLFVSGTSFLEMMRRRNRVIIKLSVVFDFTLFSSDVMDRDHSGRTFRKRQAAFYWACSAPPGGRSCVARSESMEANCSTWKRKSGRFSRNWWRWGAASLFP